MADDKLVREEGGVGDCGNDNRTRHQRDDGEVHCAGDVGEEEKFLLLHEKVLLLLLCHGNYLVWGS